MAELHGYVDQDPSNRRILRISLVGSGGIRVGDSQIEIKQRKVFALVGLLALSENTSATRDRVVGLLWSEFSEDKAKTSLRQALHLLRQQFDAQRFAGFYTDKQLIALNRDLIEVDLWTAIEQAESGVVVPELLTAADYCDSVLAGLEDLDPLFRVWVLSKRQSLQERLLRALERILAQEQAGAERLRAAEALINLDPTHEEAVRFLMRARAEAQNVGAALRLYKKLWDALDEDFGMEPSVETQNLVVEIKSGSFDGTTSAPVSAGSPAAEPADAAAPPRRLVLAVAPFSDGSRSDDRQHLFQGFRHSVIGCLIRFREWRIMDLAEPATDDTKQYADFLVETTILQSDGAAVLVITLKDVQSSLFVWSDRFELQVSAWVALLARVVRSVTTALNVYVSSRQIPQLADHGGISEQLYDTWLRGQLMISRLEPEDWQQASRLFDEVIRQAPDFAPAYSSLVQLKNSQHIVHPGVFQDPDRQSEALRLARVAGNLDPIDSRTQLCLAWACAYSEQFGTAEVHFELAESLNEFDPWTLMSAAQGLAFLANPERAIKLADRAVENLVRPRPLDWGYLAGIRCFAGDYSGAFDAATEAGDFLAHNGIWRAVSLVRMGKEGAARAEAKHCLEVIRERWRGERAPTDQAILRWVLELFPIKNEVQRETLRSSLATAGFPASAS